MKSFLFNLAIIILVLVPSCSKDDWPDLDFKQEMRDFVIAISEYAKAHNSDFLIIPQNGQEVNTVNGDNEGDPHLEYLSAIDCIGQEDLYYGYKKDDKETPSDETSYMVSLCNVAKSQGVVILVTDYCSTHSNMDDSYARNSAKGFISFAANSRELNNIPNYPLKPYNENNAVIETREDIKNFLYLINPA